MLCWQTARLLLLEGLRRSTMSWAGQRRRNPCRQAAPASGPAPAFPYGRADITWPRHSAKRPVPQNCPAAGCGLGCLEWGAKAGARECHDAQTERGPLPGWRPKPARLSIPEDMRPFMPGPSLTMTCRRQSFRTAADRFHQIAPAPHERGDKNRGQAETANSVIIPVDRCGMWWQCSIQRAASPASSATVTIVIGGT